MTGFTHFVAKKQAALTSYWRRRWLQIFKSYFTIPRLFLTIFMFGTCFQMIELFGSYAAFILFLICITSKVLAISFIHLKVRKSKIKLNNYLFFSTSLAFLVPPFYFDYIVFQLVVHSGPLHELIYFDATKNIILSMLTTISIIFTHANFTLLPKMLTDEIKNKYAHLGLNFN